MSRRRVTVLQVARDAGLDVDEALITLWDAGFEYVNGPGDLLSKGDVNRARRVLGLATRRELASADYWQSQLGLSGEQFVLLLQDLGVKKLPVGGRLPKKAIHRLNAELRARGIPSVEIADTARAEAEPEISPLVWEPVGHLRDIRYLTDEEVVAIHVALVEDFLSSTDPISPPGVRSADLLSSAAYRLQTEVDGIRKYPTVEVAASALLHAVVHNHPFHNGNKRTALVSMLVFLDENGLVLTCNQDALFKLVLQLAQHALVSGPRSELSDREVMAVAQWIHSNSRWLQMGDRAIPFRRLRRILTEFECTFEFPASGSRVNISRTVQLKTRFFGRRRSQVLRTQTHYAAEGREVDRNSINRIRRDLELDDAHGIDSRGFYDNDPASRGDFIVTYRKTLRRLARL